ncbi:hypothetical protein G6F37_002995 [Rhizopus arrhizus]|nr:hypothetical protein G6F38_002991 [Rhizopus arrhizus]KAG1161525.1 hypothetical protein G6F37_002995 [Rhizopus arrhizus]
MSLSIKDQLEIILLQEEKCQFNLFTSQTALDLGLMLIENAKPFNKPVVIDITLNGHQLFRYAMQGTNRDNDEWVRRKNNVVDRFHHSSYYVGRHLANQCVVGTITVSGLTQEDDHNLVANTIQELLAIQQKQ